MTYIPPLRAEPNTAIGRDLDLLLEAARAGSAPALGEALEATRQYLLAVANRELRPELRSKIAPSDLVQEAFVDAQQSLAGFRGGSARGWRGWLRTILLRNLLDHTRRHATALKHGDAAEGRALVPGGEKPGVHVWADPDPTPATTCGSRELIAHLNAALERLPPDWQQVIRLRLYEGLPFEQVGARMDRTAEAARKLCVRAVAQLRQEFAGQEALLKG